MAIRKPAQPRTRPVSLAAPATRAWPYPISESVVRVRADGTIVIPAALARLLASEEGEDVRLRVMSDGHLEADSARGRSEPAGQTGQVYSTEEFVRALQADARPR